MNKLKIDSKDIEILRHLQLNSDISLKDLSKKVGLSTTPCWLRIKKLQENKILRNRPYIIDRYLLNLKVTAFVFIKTKNHNIEWSNKLVEVVSKFPEIVSFYRMSGEIDYLLKVIVKDLDDFDLFYKKLISEVELDNVTSSFSLEEIKNTTELPIKLN